MKNWIIGLAILWRGLFIGAEQTQVYSHMFKPNLTVTTAAFWSIGKVTLRAGYIQPTTAPYGPVAQFGFSVRIF